MATTTPPTPKRRAAGLLWVWIALACLVGAFTIGSGGLTLFNALHGAPATAAVQFCQNLKTQHYDDAYGQLSARSQKLYTLAQFRQYLAWLDSAEGTILTCSPAQGTSAYRYSIGDNTALYAAATFRQRQGTLQGGMLLVNEGDWKVDALDASLLGVKLSALKAFQSFCAAMTTQKYTTVYGYLGKSAQASTTQAEFVHLLQVQDTLDGKASACNLLAVPSGNTETKTTLTATLTRAKYGATSGPISFELSPGVWTISAIDPMAQGTDLGALAVEETFCADLVAGKLAQSYSLFSDGFRGQFSQTQFLGLFALPQGAKFTGCPFTLATYKAAGDKAVYSGKLVYAPAGGTAQSTPLTLYFFKANGHWAIDDYRFA